MNPRRNASDRLNSMVTSSTGSTLNTDLHQASTAKDEQLGGNITSNATKYALEGKTVESGKRTNSEHNHHDPVHTGSDKKKTSAASEPNLHAAAAEKKQGVKHGEKRHFKPQTSHRGNHRKHGVPDTHNKHAAPEKSTQSSDRAVSSNRHEKNPQQKRASSMKNTERATGSGPAAPREAEPWPMYRIDTKTSASQTIHERWPWPGVGWNPDLSIENSDFANEFKFYMYDDGPFDMRDADRCWRKSREIAPPEAKDSMEELDSSLRVNQREYFTELFLLPTLREHKMRTMDKSQAKLFIIGYANPMARLAGKDCVTRDYGSSPDEWDGRVAKALRDDEYFVRNSGRDFLFLHSLFKVEMSKTLKEVLDSGPIIATFDRYSSFFCACVCVYVCVCVCKGSFGFRPGCCHV